MAEKLRRIARRVTRPFVLAYFHWKGPPRILRFDSDLNKALLARFGAKIGTVGTYLHAPLVVHIGSGSFHNLVIADYCVLEGQNYLDLTSEISLERGVTLGAGVTIMTHNNYNHNTLQERRLSHTCGALEVRIGRGAQIGARSLIIMGVTVGEGALVEEGSVVNRDIPGGCIAGGIPAKVRTTGN